MAEAALREEIKRLDEVELAAGHPAFLLHHVRCVDSRSGEIFEFELLSEEEAALIHTEVAHPWIPGTGHLTEWERGIIRSAGGDWTWQRDLLEEWLEFDQCVSLKGRQLGVTWVACGLALWYLLFKPGTDVLVYSMTEDDAKEVIGRIWDMLCSIMLPREDGRDMSHLMNGAKVIRPSRPGTRPSEGIAVQHPDGRVSSIEAMTGTKRAGHGRSAALIIFDEKSRQDYARDIWKAIVPATADKGGKIVGISTANGMSDPTTKQGNFFHEVYVGAGGEDYPTIHTNFLRWDLHPDRDEDWYESLNLDEDARAEQYPMNPEEAFLMSGSPFFDVSALKRYVQKGRVLQPLYRCRFVTDPVTPARARLEKLEGGPISVFSAPEQGRKYAMAADLATGSGADYSVAAVIDLATMEPVAELHSKMDYDTFAEQIHFLGLWYNTARIAPEKGGGYGDVVIAYLRDGKNGRKPYPRLYRFKRVDRQGVVKSDAYGFPMNQQSRPLVINELKKAIREGSLPALTPGLLTECRTFVHRDTRPSPRAADGANDDRVMAWGIALELFREFGEHEHDIRDKNKKPKKPKQSFPW